MTQTILVINPNSTHAVTVGISDALETLRFPGGPSIECVTLTEGPPGVESQRDADGVILPLANLARKRDADAYVIACYSDPGLYAVREAVPGKPVLGIAECAMLTALTRGERFGVISILAASVPRHLRYVRMLGLGDRLAGDLPIGLGVLDLSEDEEVLHRMTETGKALRDELGADVLILGCAGMARFRRPLEEALGLPVVEPSLAATTMALGTLRAG